jgi:hypothetical protein
LLVAHVAALTTFFTLFHSAFVTVLLSARAISLPCALAYSDTNTYRN